MSTRNSSGKHNGATVPRTALSALSLALLSVHALAQDLPTGEVVKHGDATFTRTDTSLTIDQRTGKLVVNWNDFNVGAGNLVDFRQNPTDIALNRVVGDNPSYIFGDIRAGGQVFLVNQAGILFSPTARVDAAGLVASTLGISDEDFLAGNYRFSGAGGSVVNKGRINVTDGGYVALLGQEAINEGIITARLGAVGLGAGDRMTLDIVGDGLVNLQVDKATVDALVENRGIIIAPGGVVLMTASAMNQLAATVVNNTGVIEATSLAERDGKVFLVAEGGNVSHTGSIDVSGEGVANGGSVLLDSDATTLVGGEILAASGNIGGLGGDVQVLGAQVALATGSEIIASGVSGGGTVLVGGDFQGSNADVRNAENTFVATGARIEADALAEGDGGKVIVWADDSTRFFGSISATGGSAGGDGGFAEVSGKRNLGFYGDVDLTAALGLKGRLLLDPQILRIIDGAAGSAGLDGTLDPAGLVDFIDSDGFFDMLSVGQIEATSLLAGISLNAGQIEFYNAADITVAADSDIAFHVSSVLAGGGDDSIKNVGANAFSINTSGAGTILFAGTGGAAAAGAIDLDGITLNSDASVTVLTDSTLTLGGVDAASLSIAGSAISQTDAAIVSGGTSISARSPATTLALTNTGNDLSGINLDGTLGDFLIASITDSTAVSVVGDAFMLNVTAGDGVFLGGGDYTTLNVTAGGDVAAPGTVTAAIATITADTNSINLDLSDTLNDFGAVVLGSANSGTFASATVTDIDDLAIGGDAATLTIDAGAALNLSGGNYDTLSITSDGDVTQGAVVTVTGATTITADNNPIAVSLGLANDFGSVTLADDGVGSVATANIADTNDLTVGGDAGSLQVTSLGAVTLSGGDITNLLQVEAYTSITQTAAVTATDATLVALNGPLTITLTEDNDFDTVGMFTAGTGTYAGTTVSVTDTDDLYIAGHVDNLVVDTGGALVFNGATYGGTVDVTAGGDVSQAGALTVQGDMSVTADGAAINVLFGGPGNDFAGAVTLGDINGGSVAIGNIIDDVGVLTVGGDADTLGVYSVGGVTLSGGTYTALTVDTNNYVNQTAAIQAATLNVSGPVSVTLDEANELGTVNLLGPGLLAVSITDADVNADALAIGGNASTLTIDAGGAVELTGSTLGGPLAVAAGGDITQSGTLSVAGTTTLTANTAPMNVSLTDAANQFSGAVSLVDGTGAFDQVAVTDVDLLEIGGNATTLTVDAGTMLVLSGGSYDDLSATSGGSFNQGGVLTVTGTATLTSDAAAANVFFGNPLNDFGAVALVESGPGTFNNVSVNDANALTFGGDGTVVVVDAGDTLTLSGGTYSSVLSATSGADITDSGTVTADSQAIFSAQTGIGLDALSAATIDADSAAGAVSIVNDRATPVTVNSLTTTGADISFTQTGAGVVSFDAVSTDGAGTISLVSDAGMNLDGAVQTAGGDVTINADADGVLTGTGVLAMGAAGSISTASGNLSITAADFDFIAGSSINLGGGALDLTASRAGDMCLGDAAGACQVNLDNADLAVLTNTTTDLTLDNGTSAIHAQSADFNNADLSLQAGTVDANNAINTALVGVGALQLTTTGAIGALNGGLTLDADSVDVTDTGGNDVTLVGTGAGGNTTYVIGSTAAVGAADITQQTNNLIVTAIDADGAVGLDATTGALIVNGAILADGGADLSGTTGISLGADVTSVDTTITFNDAVTLTADVGVATGAGAGDIVFIGAVDGAQALALSAGTGNVDMQAAVGGLSPLTTLTVTDATTASFVDVTTTGIQDITAGTIETNGTHSTTDSDITLTGNVQRLGATAFDTGAGLGDLVVTGTLNGAFSLDIDTGAGNVELQDLVTAGAFTIANAADVDLQAAVSASSFTQTAGTGTTTIGGALTVSTGDIVIKTADIVQDAAIEASREVILEAANAIALNSGSVTAGTRLIHLTAGTGVTQDAANHGGLIATDLLLEGSGDFTLVTTTHDNLVSNVASAGTIGGFVALENDQAITVGSVNDLLATGHDGIAADGLVLVANGTVTVNQAISSTTGVVGIGASSGDIAVNANISSADVLSMQAAGAGATIAINALGVLDATTDLVVSADLGVLTMAPTAMASAGGNILLAADGDVTVTGVSGTDVRIESASGSILDAGEGQTDVTATNLVLSANGDVGDDGTGNGRLDVNVGNLAVEATTGSAWVRDTADMTVTSVASFDVEYVQDITGATTTDTLAALAGATANDNLVLTAGTSLTLDAAAEATTGNLLLDAQGGDLDVNTAVLAGSNASLLASANVLLDANVEATAGTLDIAAAGGNIEQADANTAMAGGNAQLVASNNVLLANLVAANARIEATAGSILDGGDANTDVVAATVQLVAGTDIGVNNGTTGLLDINADTLALDAGNDAFVRDIDGLTVASVAAIDVERVALTGAPATQAGALLAGALAGNDLVITAASTLDIDSAVDATAGDLLLQAEGGDLTVNATVDAGANASLIASANVGQTATGDITTGGTLEVEAQAGDITMTDGAISIATGNARYLASGSISVGGISAANARLEATAGSILDAGDANTDVVATTVQLIAGTDIGVNNGTTGLLDIDADTLALDAGNDAFVRDIDGLVVGSVAAIDVERVALTGVPATQAGALLAGALAGNDLVITAASTLDIDSAVDATAGDLLLQAEGGDLTINAATDAGANASLIASANVGQTATGDITTGGTLEVEAQAGDITMTDGAISIATGNARYLASGSIHVGGISAANARLEATAGSILDAGDANTDVVATTVQLIAGTDIGVNNGTTGLLDIDADTLALDAGNDAFVRDIDGLVVGSVAAIDVERVALTGAPATQAGALLAGAIAGNDLVITAADALTIDSATDATAGDLLLQAEGGDLTVNATVDAGANASLIASANVGQTATGDITTGGTLEVEAQAGDITMTDGATSIATGNARYLASGSIHVGGISAANARIEATAGSILDGGDANTDVVATTVQLIAGTDIGVNNGTTGLLDIDADTLALDAGNDAFVRDINGLVVGSVAAIDVERVALTGAPATQAGALLAGAIAGNDLVITAADALTIDSATDATAGDLLLQAEGGDLTVNATVDAGANASLIASANVGQTATGDITTGGTLEVEAQAGDITMTDGATSIATGNARYLASGSIHVGGISAANARLEAGGSILDNGDTDTDVIAATIQLIANVDIGTTGNALETDTDLLAADAATGGVFISEFDFLEIGTVAVIDVERVALTGAPATQAGALLEGVQAALDIDVEADDMDISREVHSAGGNISLLARAGGIEQTGAPGAVIADAGDIDMTAADGSIYLQLVSALGNQVTLTASQQIVNNNGAGTNVIADVLVASAADYIGATAGYFTDPDVNQRITTQVEDSITVTLSQAGTVAIDNASSDGDLDVVFNLPMADVDNGSSVWVRNNEALRAFGLEFATENNAVEFNGNLQLLAEQGDLWLNEDQVADGNPVDLVAQWMRLSAPRGGFLNGDGTRFLQVGDGLSLTADDLVLVTGGDLGVAATADRLNVIGTGLYGVVPGGAPGDGGEAADLDLQLERRDIALVDAPILFETIVVDRQGEPEPSWIADLNAWFPYGWAENTYALFTTGTANVVSLRQDDGVNVTHDGSIRFVDHVQAGALSDPSDLTIAVRAGQFGGTSYAGTVYVDFGVDILAENVGTGDTGTVAAYGSNQVNGSVVARDGRSIELQGRGGDIIIDSDTSAAGRVLLSPGLGYNVIFTNAATFRVTQGLTAEGDLVILAARNVLMDPGTAIVADGSVLIGADNSTGQNVLLDGANAVEGDVVLYNVLADANGSGTGDIVVYTTGARAGETYDFDYGNGVYTHTVTGSITLGRQDVVDGLEAALVLDPAFLDIPANIPAPALTGQNVQLVAAGSILSGWAVDYAGATLRPEQEPVHIVALQELTLDARGGVVGGTADLAGAGTALIATEQPLRVQVGDLMTIGAGEHDENGISANLVGNAERLDEIDRVPGLIAFNGWNVGGALEGKFVSGTSVDTTSYQLFSYGMLGRNSLEATTAYLRPTHSAVLDMEFAPGQVPGPVPALWREGEATAAVNEFAEPAPQQEVVEEVVEEVAEVMLPAPEALLEAAVRRAHEVREGDTLWQISKEYLGNPYRWTEIWERMPSIQNPDLIYPGQEIKIDNE